jgi:gluconate 2-dehydrogenase alpha chain
MSQPQAAPTAPVGNTKLAGFDALVIGAGAAGSTVAFVLTQQGKKVLLLDAGPNWFLNLDNPAAQPVALYSNDELKLSYRNFVTPSPLVEPRTWRNTPSDGARTYVGDVQGLPKTVGGGAVHADLKMPRFAPDDFHLGTLLGTVQGASFADWPVDYDALEPFYAYMEKIVGVQGVAGANPFEGPRSTPFPMGPGVEMYCASLVGKGLSALGYTMFPYPMAVTSQPYDGRPACVDCGLCSGFGCPNNAKGSPPVTTLRKALLTGNCLLLPCTRAVKLLTNETGSEITGVDAIGPDGKHLTLTASQYVLAATPIEDARLLLLSDPGGAGVGNSSGYVGRNLMFHLQTNMVAVFDERIHGHRGKTVSNGFADFRGKPNDPNHPLGGIVEISGSEGVINETDYILQVVSVATGFDGLTFKKLLRQSPFRDHLIAMAMQAEDAPQLTNVVDLDPEIVDLDGLPVPRITYQNHSFELSASAFYGPKMVEILGKAGAHWAAVAPLDTIPQSDHIMGTLRFGNDPTSSVCGPNGQFHDVGNLWAADASLFPTSSGFNPTMTLISLACRVAGCIVFGDSPERVLS